MTRTEIETLVRAWATAVARGGDDATWRALLAPSLADGRVVEHWTLREG